MQIVSFFNHKGGVGKTTMVFNTALALASQGRRVLMVDVDAQANLTSLALEDDLLERSIDEDQTIWSALSPLVTGAGDIRPVVPLRVRDDVWIAPGDLRMSSFEAITPTGWTEALAGQERGFRTVSALYRFVQRSAETVGADFAFLDLGPNVNVLNGTALLSSDGFLVPMAPDLFSVRALPSVGTSVARWIKEWRTAQSLLETEPGFELPPGSPVPLGYVSQQFSVYRRSASEAYQRWMDRIPGAYEDGIVVPLAAEGVHAPADSQPEIATIPNFYSLIPIAQDVNKAVFELTGSEARGAQFTRARQTRETFLTIASEIDRRTSGES